MAFWQTPSPKCVVLIVGGEAFASAAGLGLSADAIAEAPSRTWRPLPVSPTLVDPQEGFAGFFSDSPPRELTVTDLAPPAVPFGRGHGAGTTAGHRALPTPAQHGLQTMPAMDEPFATAGVIADRSRRRQDCARDCRRERQERACDALYNDNESEAISREYVKAESDLASAARDANAQIRNSNEGMFVTALVGVLDYATGRLEYVNAGHNPPPLRQRNGDCL